MQQFVDCTLDGQRVELDGNSYKGVVFNNCIMVFKGTDQGNLSLVGCSFNNCSWHFEENAATTITFINNLAGAMGGNSGKKFIKNLFKNHF